MSKIIAISGAHGTGKSESVLHVAQYYMRKDPARRVGVLHEIASESPFPINFEATADTQTWIFTRQLAREIEMMGVYDRVVSDRSVVDAIAYTEFLGFTELAKAMRGMAANHVRHYERIIFKTIAINPFCFDNGLREASDNGFRSEIEDRMLAIYADLGIDHKLQMG